MYIELCDLFFYRQYKDFPVQYFFDKKSYTIVDEEYYLKHRNDEVYSRMIPLFQIDEVELQDDFIRDFNQKKLLYDYEHKTRCFEAFAQDFGLWDRWWDYYTDRVYQIAANWCIANNIRYKNTIRRIH